MPAAFDTQREADRLIAWIAETTRSTFHREGAVVGVSGGVDSSTVLYLLAKALGPERVVAPILPDRDSSPDSANLALTMTSALGIEAKQVDLTAALAAMGCYDARDNAIKRAVPGFDPARCSMSTASWWSSQTARRSAAAYVPPSSTRSSPPRI
jgi:NAD+ synthase